LPRHPSWRGNAFSDKGEMALLAAPLRAYDLNNSVRGSFCKFGTPIIVDACLAQNSDLTR